MIRALMLGLTLLLITLVSAQLAGRQNFAEVKLSAEVPLPSVSAPAEPSPPPSPQPSEPPRFLEEIEPPATPGPTVIPQVTALPSQSEVNPSVDAAQGATPLDPSAAQHQSEPSNSPQPEPSPKVPTQEELRKIAAPYLKELYAAKDSAFDQMATIEQKATTDFLSTPIAARQKKLQEMAGTYLPQVTMLVGLTDEKVNAIILRLIAALAAVGGDDSLAADARAAYEQEKNENLGEG